MRDLPLRLEPIGRRAMSVDRTAPAHRTRLYFVDNLHLVNIGPLWFAVLLLIFDLGTAAWRALTRNHGPRPTREPGPPSFLEIAIYVALFAAALRNVDLDVLPRFGMLAVIAIPASFGVAYLLRRVPLVARVV